MNQPWIYMYCPSQSPLPPDNISDIIKMSSSGDVNFDYLCGGGDLPGGSDGKCLPTMQESWVQSLGLENLLEKEMATHSSNLAWKEYLLLWMEEPGRLQSTGSQRVGYD